MSLPPPLSLLTLLVLSLLPIPSSSSSSSALSTVAISHVGNKTLVCGLLPSRTAPDRYDLNCTAYPGGRTRYYPSDNDVTFSAITAGDGFLCALASSPSSPSVMLWWDFAHNTHNNSIPDAKKVYQGPPVLSLSAGDSHVCGLTANSPSPYCWRWPHLPIPDRLNITDIAVGGGFVCALLRNGTITCFGSNNNVGIVGREPPGRHTKLAAGSTHACALSARNELVCWGAGAPSVATGPAPVDSLALGNNRTCVLYVGGRVVCWGPNAALPKDVAASQFMAIEARGDAFCGVLLVNYSLVCWGSEVFHRKHVVFRQVLPGTCAPVSSCSCGVVPGSGTLCAADGAICRTCSRHSGAANQPQLNSPTTNRRRVHKKKRRSILVLLVSVGIGIGTLAAAFFFFYFRFGHRYCGRVHDLARVTSRTPTPTLANAAASPTIRHRQESGMDRQLSQFLSKGHGATIEEFPIKSLLEITDGFSDEHKIGSGSFGSVYRAKLADGRVVAIKRAEPTSRASTSRACSCRESAFVAEVALLSRVNHKNLVRLLGYCRDGSERILVYEFMSNGSLHSLLHKPDSQPDSPVALGSWPARIRVALDAARGIDYLHTYAVPPIIHRDIKSSNILLEEDWTAKVSDFGLSLMTPDATDDELSSGSFGTAGTVGYMDPEYYRLQHLNAKSDVYSFGVVLLEILSGCKVIGKYGAGDSPKNVVQFAVPHIAADDIPRVLDRRLPPPTPAETEAVAFVAYLAADSVSPEGRLRPTMTEIVNGLERALAACATRTSTSRSLSIDSGAG